MLVSFSPLHPTDPAILTTHDGCLQLFLSAFALVEDCARNDRLCISSPHGITLNPSNGPWRGPNQLHVDRGHRTVPYSSQLLLLLATTNQRRAKA
jgi:hypothetical protein